MKSAILVSIFWLNSLSVLSQNICTHSPVTFPTGKVTCDTRPLKTVFYDGFDGSTLKAPWMTFKSWQNMNGGDNENWEQARLEINVISKASNIEVSNGTVKLKVRREPSSWKCASCPTMNFRNFSGAMLALPFTNKGITSGYLEARIKMPNFYKSHCTMWTWDGSEINEIDIAEAYGRSGYGGAWDYPHVNYSTHAWWLRQNTNQNPNQNPCNLDKDVELRNRYPNSDWWHWNFDRIFKVYDFNTYACDWDTSRVRFYLNGSEIGTIWKYYGYKKVWVLSNDPTEWNHVPHYKLVQVRVGNTCSGDGSTIWNVTPGFPYSPTASQLRFSAVVDDINVPQPPFPTPGNAFLGEMEIDYVKIAQRTIDPGFTPCDAPLSPIYGGEHICGNATKFVYASHSSPTGNWTCTPNIQITAQNYWSALITSAPNAGAGVGYVSYFPSGVDCHPASGGASQSSNHQVYLWKPANVNVAVARSTSIPNRRESFFSYRFLTKLEFQPPSQLYVQRNL